MSRPTPPGHGEVPRGTNRPCSEGSCWTLVSGKSLGWRTEDAAASVHAAAMLRLQLHSHAELDH